MGECKGHGKQLPLPPPSDEGATDAALAAARTRPEVLAALVGARVFAAVTATATTEEVTEHGVRADSAAEMAVLLLESPDGRALPVFSSLEALARWRRDARPVPLTGSQACRAAQEQGLQGVVLDPAGEPTVLSGSEVDALATGYVPVEGTSLAAHAGDVALETPQRNVPPELVTALRSALSGERLRAARVLEGPQGLVLGVTPRTPLGPAGLAALAHRLSERLGAALPAEGLDVAEVPERPLGVRVLPARRWLRRVR